MDALYLLSTTGHFPLIAKLFHVIGPDLPTYWKIAEGRACCFTGWELGWDRENLNVKEKEKRSKTIFGFYKPDEKIIANTERGKTSYESRLINILSLEVIFDQVRSKSKTFW